jgi:hypothetical protein
MGRVITPTEQDMSGAQATAEVFWTAFMAMTEDERRAFLARLLAARSRRSWLRPRGPSAGGPDELYGHGR